MCGDSTNEADYKLLFGEKKADLCVTSPPYNVMKHERLTGSTKEEQLNFIKTWIQNMKKHMNNYRYFVINLGDQCHINLAAWYSVIMEQEGLKYSRTIYWVKSLGASLPTITLSHPFPRWYLPKVHTESILIHVNLMEEEPIEQMNVLLSYSLGEVKGKERPDPKITPIIPKTQIKKYLWNVWKFNPDNKMFYQNKGNALCELGNF